MQKDKPPKDDQKREHQSRLNGKLMNAVRGGDLDGARESVRQGADVNCEYKGITDWPDWSPLLFATKQRHKGLVVFLLDSGARIDHESDSGNTSMILASLNRDREMCILLLKRGAKLHEGTRIRYPTSVEGYFKRAYGLIAEGRDLEGYETWQQAFRVRLGDIEMMIKADADTPLYMDVDLGNGIKSIPWTRGKADTMLYMDRRDCHAYLEMVEEARSSFNNAQEVLLKEAVKDNQGTGFAESARGLLDDLQRSGTE